MKSVVLGLVLMLLGLPAAAQQPFRTIPLGQATLTVLPDGRWSLTAPDRPPVTSAYVVIASPEWKGSVGQSALKRTAAPAEEGGALVFRGTLTEPATKVVWRLEERLEPAGEALKLSYDLSPESDTAVGEVCLFFDLPIDAWRGREAVFLPSGRAILPEQPAKPRHFLAGRARKAFLGAEQPVSLAFAKPALCTVQDTREFKGSSYQLYARAAAGAAMKAGEHCRLELVLKPRDPEGLPVEPSYRSAAPLHVGPVTLPPGRAECFGRLELPLDVTGTWDTPFDADQVRVDAHVTTPGGGEQVVPAFYTRPYRLERDGSGALAEPDGEPGWRLRYAPTKPGRHTLYVTARDRSGEQRSAAVSFDAAASAAPGYLRVSRTDPHYFAFDNGRPYFAVGENMATGPVFAYDTWMERLGDAGGNYARVWMCSSCFGIEYGPPGLYRMDAAAELDHVFDLAEQNGIYIKLCLEAWRGFSGEGSFVWQGAVHPYDQKNGGPCATEMDFFSNPEARRLFQNRLRYLVARWGCSTHLLAWEFWNEINCVRGFDQRSQEMIDWSAAMGDYLHTVDPWHHLVVNSLGSFEVDDRLWKLPQIEFAQVHGYWHPTLAASKDVGKDMGEMVPLWLSKVRGYGKPALFAEYGLVNPAWGPSPRADEDRDGVALHNGLWSAMAAGACGTAMLWWWDSHVDKLDLYHQFTPVAKFTADVPWDQAGFRPVAAEASDPRVRALALMGRDRALLWLQNRAHTWWNVVEKQPIPPVDAATVTLAGLPDGEYTVEWWDTWSGVVSKTETLRSSRGKLGLEVAGLARDVAAKVTTQARPR